MPEIGQTVSHYRIVEKIGQGGMGEVYLADDTTLNRKVALKFLPEAFTSDPERMARFEREAKLLASLNHPNIAGIHGLEQDEGNRFLVLEYVEGETLQARVSKGALSIEDTLAICRQIAEGLEAAHEKGIIHRDLKPGNVMVTAEEKVKILDFGLAKALADETQTIDPADSPTITEAITQPGVVLGTAAYMSPEQAKGKSVDKRADVWAFGCILYECLTRKKAFEGETASETLASVMKSEPEWDSLPHNLHSRIRLLLERCLEKDPKNRYSGISDARVDVQKVLADPGGLFAQPDETGESPKKQRAILPWIAVTAVLCLIIAGVAGWMLKPSLPPEPKRVMRSVYELPEDQMFTHIGMSVVDLSADGTKIVYVANQQLYLRNLNELTSRSIQGTNEDPTVPFFSPDGLWVGYYSRTDGQWKKITVSGGAPVTLCDADLSTGATWSLDNTILFEEAFSGIKRVSGNGGTTELLIEEKEGKRFHRPQALPGAEWVIFSISGKNINSWDDAQIVAQSLKTGERRILVSGGSDARYIPTGHLVYALGGVLYARAFDVDNIEVIGGAVPIVEGVQQAPKTGSANYGISDTGMLVYVVEIATTAIRHSLVWVDRNGEEEPLGAPPDEYLTVKISPDGTKVALTIGNLVTTDIWIWDVFNKNMPRLTIDENSDFPLWTLNGQRIVFQGEENAVYWRAADGTGNDELIGSGPGLGSIPNAWSGDGKTLVTFGYVGGTNVDIGSISMEGDHSYKPLLQEEYMEIQPRISPDGKWMAYASNESGSLEICVRPFPDVDKGRWQVSKDGGNSPLWSPNGKELFYRHNDEVIAVSVETEPTFKPVKSEILFRKNYVHFIRGYWNQWDIHPDGNRFLMLKESSSDATTEETQRPTINIVLNWFEELKEKVPVD